MIEHLNAINFSKENIMRNAPDLQAAEKAFPAFPVLRGLSYHVDAIAFVNELNIRSMEQFGLTPLMKFEFLMYVLSKKKRFSKWAKSSKEEEIELIVEFEGVSYKKAAEVLDLIPREKMDYLKKLHKEKYK